MNQQYAVCESCKQPMGPDPVSCISEPITIDGVERARLHFGAEKGFAEGAFEHPCHDCGIVVGQFHHDGCDLEQCPNCGGQLLACDCDLERS
jgi:hypothetical protein